jgi:hypothetical protein
MNVVDHHQPRQGNYEQQPLRRVVRAPAKGVGTPWGALCDGVAQCATPSISGGWGRGSPDEEFADHLDDRTGVAFCAGAVWPQPATMVR